MKEIVLEEEEWACLDHVVDVLYPLKAITLESSKKRGVSIDY
jgi:hypothetical protein